MGEVSKRWNGGVKPRRGQSQIMVGLEPSPSQARKRMQPVAAKELLDERIVCGVFGPRRHSFVQISGTVNRPSDQPFEIRTRHKSPTLVTLRVEKPGSRRPTETPDRPITSGRLLSKQSLTRS